jgi:hypothetical protein
MPKIFQYLNYVIRFYSNDHLPIHVHVQVGREQECKVDFLVHENDLILLFRKVKGKRPLSQTQVNEVSVFLKAYKVKIIEKWQKVFIYQQDVTCEVIRLKLKRK